MGLFSKFIGNHFDLEQSSILLDALMENLPDAVFFKDRDSRFILVNKTLAEKVYLLDDPGKAVGKTDFDFFAEEHARRFSKTKKKSCSRVNPSSDTRRRNPCWTDASCGF